MDWIATLAVVVGLMALLYVVNYVLSLRDECARLRDESNEAWQRVIALEHTLDLARLTARAELERAQSDAAIMAVQNMYLSQQQAECND